MFYATILNHFWRTHFRPPLLFLHTSHPDLQHVDASDLSETMSEVGDVMPYNTGMK